MDSEKFNKWCIKNNISAEACKEIENIRSSGPSRLVRSTAKNVSGRYPSRKMGVTIQFESHRNELAYIYAAEHNPKILEYYDQPPPILFNYKGKEGRNLGHYNTTDFFEILPDKAGWVECKTEKDLKKLSVKSPNRYVRKEDGTWRCPPGEEYAARFGLFFRVLSSKEINWVYQRNIMFLEDYLLDDSAVVSKEIEDEITSFVKSEPGLLLTDLLQKGYDPDDINGLIAQQKIYVDIYGAPLAEPTKVKLFLSPEVAEAYSFSKGVKQQPSTCLNSIKLDYGTVIAWDGILFEIMLCGRTSIVLKRENSDPVELDRNSFMTYVQQGKITGIPDIQNELSEENRKKAVFGDPEALKEANRRARILSGDCSSEENVSERTLRRWRSNFEKSESVHGNGYSGLIPLHNNKGNRLAKLPERVRSFIDTFIDEDYETLKQKKMRTVHNSFREKCEHEGVAVPTLKTFRKYVRRRLKEKQTKKRKGSRAASQHEGYIYWMLDPTTPRHGDRPFEICHIDHTEGDIELISSRTNRNLGRPWITFMTDAYSRRLLSTYVTFDAPSYRSLMMVIRECVRRFGRLPQTVVVDGGKEFGSVYFESLLARYEITKKTRPKAKSRFGSVCERLFGTSNTEFIHNLAGNTQIMKNVRQVTKSVNPKNLALWNLKDFSETLEVWAHEIYDTAIHTTLDQSPKDAFLAGISLTGKRPVRLISYDDNFKISTLPTTKKGKATIRAGQGMKVNHIYYWNEAFRDPAIEKTKVFVRYDPFDLSTAYAYVYNQWVECQSEYYHIFKDIVEKEQQIITAELRRLKKQNGKEFEITGRKLAEFIENVEDREAQLKARMLGNEAKPTIRLIEDGKPRTSPKPLIEQDRVKERPKSSSSDNDNDSPMVYEEFV